MSLFTKSIQERKKKSDGMRVCVMRRPGNFNDRDFDVWMPILAPSHQLLNDIHAERIEWDSYVKRFNQEVIKGKRKILEILTKLALEHDITLLCWEKTPEKCHRRLLAEKCLKMNSDLKVTIK